MKTKVVKDQYAVDSHKKAVMLWSKYVEEGNFQKLENLMTQDCILNMPNGEAVRGLEKIIDLEKEFHTAFPDLKYETKDQIAEGDELCTRILFSGTHRGIYNGIAPSNKRVEVPAMWICKFTDEGRIKECWSEYDSTTLMNQITN